MSIHPQFFDSVDEFVAHRVAQWEQDNPYPIYDIPTQPEKPEPQLITLQQNSGFIVVQTRTGSDFTLTIQKGNLLVNISIQYPNELIDALMYVLAESEELHEWNSRYKPQITERDRKITYLRQEREKVVQESIAAYQALKSSGNAQNEANHE